MKQKIVRYGLASVFSIWLVGETLFHNTVTNWTMLPIFLASIVWGFSFGIAEKAYKNRGD